MSCAAHVPGDPSAERLLGVSLSQYAGVQAAIALGLSLSEALANERLSTKKWERCRTAWAGRLAREGHSGPLSTAFQDRLAEATRWLGHTISPLEEDLSAWLGFLGAYAAGESPKGLLDKLGLRSEDVQRLVFMWKRRTDKDAALARKAQDILAKNPRTIPTVRVGTAKLRPFPWSPGPEAKAPPEAVVRPQVALPLSMVDVETPRLSPSIETPSFLLEPPAPLASGAIGGTALAFTLAPSADALPFSPPAESAPVIVGEARTPAKQSGETLGVFELPKALLPFSSSTETAGKKAPIETGTLLEIEAPTRRELPFGERPVASPPEEGSSRTMGDSPLRPSAPLSTGTILAPDSPADSAAAALPFRESNDSMGERVGSLDLSALVRAVQARGPEKSPSPAPVQRAEPSASVGSRSSQKPALTLEQHASLCAELAFAPNRAAELLARYGVTAESKRWLDDLYSSETEQKVAWDTAYRTYHAWLSSAGARRT